MLTAKTKPLLSVFWQSVNMIYKNNSSQFLIVVSNPSLQHTPFLIQQLATISNSHIIFCTAFYLPNNKFVRAIVPSTVYKNFFKPAFKQITNKNNVEIKTNWQSMCFSLIGKFLYSLAEERVFKQDQIHDKWVSNFVKKKSVQYFIGYEKSCYKTFLQLPVSCKKILDVAQVHPFFIEQLRNTYSFFRKSTGSNTLFELVSAKKVKEYDVADEIWTISSFASKSFNLNQVNFSNKIKQHTLGVNKEIFKPKALPSIPSCQPLQLIYTGICHARKGLHILLDAMEILYNNRVECFLTIIGPPGNATAMLRQKKQDNVTYIDAVSHIQLASYLQKADVFVFPSFLDSWGMSVVEAMACGLPVIVSENSGAAELVTKECGFVIPINNVNILTDKILFFCNNPANVICMGQKSVRAIENISWNAYGNSVRECIKND
jgi:glycosyltransferase involved in cell wall biosynthesis